MSAIIIVSPLHKQPAPLVYNLGDTSLIITSDYGAPEAFELVAPVISDETDVSEDAPKQETVILDTSETYYLYQCLTVLFGQAGS